MAQEPMSTEEEAAYRAEVAKETFGEVAGETPPAEPIAAEPEPEPAPAAPVDPWAGVSPAVREQLEGLSSKVGSLDQIDHRLKQFESRVGSIERERHAAKLAATTAAEAPSQKQMDDAAKSTEKWNELKGVWPEWAEGIEERLAGISAAPKVDLTAIREQIREEVRADMRTEVNETLEKRFVKYAHPQWETTVKTPEFNTWLTEQPGATKALADSEHAEDAITVFDSYATFQKTQKSNVDILADREKRLKIAETKDGQRLPPAKSEADMSEDELRQSIAKEVYG